MRIILAAILLLALMAPVSAESVKEYPILRIGVIATRDIVSAEYTWGQTLEMLSKALPEHEFVMVELGADYQKAVRDGTVDFVIGNPGQYVELEAAYGASRIATVEFVGGPNPSQALGSTLFVKSGRSDIRALEDIRGHSLVAIAPELFGGFRLAWRELAQRGVDPFTDTSATRFVGEPVDRVFSAVSNGQADIGVVRSCLLERLASKGKIDASKFTVIEGWRPPNLPCQVSTPLYPDWPFAKLARTPNALAKQVALTLLAMPPDENGQSWTIPVDYQPVNDVFRALKIGPYEYLRQHSWSQVLTDYWQWLAAATLCFAWVLFSLARVQYLVQVRTQELKDANLQARREREKREHAARLSLMGEMASSLAHEISQPLAAIVNYARGMPAPHRRRPANG